MKLSTKITVLVLSILLLIIVVMGLLFYQTSKSFYKEHIAYEVEHRLVSHAEILEEDYLTQTIEHMMRMEQLESVHFVFFDPSLSPMSTSDPIPQVWLDAYRDWTAASVSTFVEDDVFPFTEYVDTGIDMHIPHVWSMQPIWIEGEVVGYLFIDQDTAEFEQTKIQLLQLIIFMGGLSFLVGLLLTVYLTQKITKPLQAISRTTSKIAEGKFDTSLVRSGQDEVGQLSRDITKMAEQLKHYRNTRRQFLSHVSHDLRTPLTYIKGYSALMKDAEQLPEDEVRRHVDVIYHEANRMEHLVQDLFQLTQLEEGKMELDLEAVNIVKWLETMVHQRQEMLKKHRLTCHVVRDNPHVYAKIDRLRMEQVLDNLLENSIRYTEEGGKITIAVQRTVTDVIVRITDTGIGIPQEDLPYIWERFYRVDKSRSSAHGGTGLGLAIVKLLVEQHGGEIGVESEPGKGTQFELKLPPADDSRQMERSHES
jgi:signal transduction histidine kinase